MVVVDSSVWIDHFNGRDTPGTRGLTALLRDGEARLVVPDLVLFEVLRGFRHDEAHREASEALGALGVEVVGGAPLAHRAAQMFRRVDERTIVEMAAVRHDQERLMRTARDRVALLERTLAADRARERALDEGGWDAETMRDRQAPQAPDEGR